MTLAYCRRRAGLIHVTAVLAGCATAQVTPEHSAPAWVDLTWLSIANMYYAIGATGVLTDGYITRVPQSAFFGGGTGLAYTHEPVSSDTAAVRRVLNAIGGRARVQLLLTGHSHFDHSLDTPTWARLTGAPIIGPKTTCLQAEALGVPAEQCTPVVGTERIPISPGVMLRVVRWNHSGDPTTNPEQHNPTELAVAPRRVAGSLGLRVGVAEDFPNGGGNRAFLFTVDGPEGELSWFYQNSASPVDLTKPIIVDGVNYGAPLENLRSAMKDAGLESVDLWIGTGGRSIAALVLPVLKPKAYLPIHWDGLFGAFEAGVPNGYADPELAALLKDAGVELVVPHQYMDKWRLDRRGVHPIPNEEVKRALGFTP
jgi:hypothetical protein